MVAAPTDRFHVTHVGRHIDASLEVHKLDVETNI